jgi:alkanesulfonate monooxygenase SsuD/methylene tetrahydromethanopterin reductase-like flavin-dependent oxidoreductase (luciferase family)
VIHETMAAAGKDPASLDTSLYFNVNLNDDREAAIAEGAKFLDVYYEASYTRERVERWTALGSPGEVADHLNRYYEAGVKEITLRATSWNQRAQFERFVAEVLPRLRP